MPSADESVSSPSSGTNRFVGADEDVGSRRTSQRAERAIDTASLASEAINEQLGSSATHRLMTSAAI